jgi:SpoVK/Ycf46/Vps4 family AAA+-type ATPase
MRVLSSNDLLDPIRGFSKECPLFGTDAKMAWKQLESFIVLPLCRAGDLNALSAKSKQSSSGVNLSGGVLLTGGSGKSSLARHCAAFAASILPSVKLLEVSCTSLIQKEVGSSERAIRRLFDCAKSASPCIVILDDVATIASVRGNDNTTEGTMDRVLSTLLTELDGVDRQISSSSEAKSFAVIGITQNEKWVDPSLLRFGRLGKIIRLGLPEKETRMRIALKEFENFHRDDVSDEIAFLAETIAERTEGLSSASIIATCNDAKRFTVQRHGAKAPNSAEMLGLMRDFLLSLPVRS